MEQQEVSVAKAGLVASLPARTAVIAAANPIGGRYNRGKSLQENLKLSPAMLSRFDLTFVLLDRPDEALDQALSEHVLAMHSGEHKGVLPLA
jgi:DNA helicase MCM8